MNNIKRNISVVISFIIIALLVVGWVINYKYSKLEISTTFFNQSQYKFWAHHGFSKEGEAYTIKNVELAFNQGLRGVELDLFYDNKRESFIIVHDKSEKDTLLLDNLLKVAKGSCFFWFDLKNLNGENTAQIIKSFLRLNNEFGLKDKFIIESKNASELNLLNEAGFYTCLWIATTQNDNVIVDSYRRFKNKLNLLSYSFNAVSMPYYYYLREGSTLYRNFPIHCWVNPEEYENYKEKILTDDQLKIVLFDRQ